MESRSDGTSPNKAHMPTIVEKYATGAITGTYSMDEEKCALFVSTFFPTKPLALPPFPGDKGPFQTPLPFVLLSVGLVCKTILKTSPHKALGLDKIPNIILHKNVAVIALLLHKCLS